MRAVPESRSVVSAPGAATLGESPSVPGESVLSKADRVLSALHEAGTCVGLADLSRRLQLPKATVHRVATELTGLGYLVKSAGGYELSWRVYEMGQTVPELARLREAAVPGLIDLRSDTRSIAVHLSVHRGADTIYLERIAGRREMAMLSRVGMRERGLRTASGRLFAAYGGMPPQSSPLQAKLETIRAQRWAAERGECVPGVKTYAVPVQFPGSTRAVASVSASVAIDRSDDRGLVHVLWSAAVEIGRELQRSAEDIFLRERYAG